VGGRPTIGVFDSGLGGLGVLAGIRRLMPSEPAVYVADQSHAPYGSRALHEIRERSFAVVGKLIRLGCDIVVIACNSASAAALHELRAALPDTRFVGMEPAVKPAVAASRAGVVGVLATEASLAGPLYAGVVDRYAGHATVISRPCPGLADLVEAGRAHDPDVEQHVRRFVEPLLAQGADTLVLGCTHYTFLRGAIRRVAGPAVKIIDPSEAVARQVGRLVLERGRRPLDGRRGHLSYLTTGDPRTLRERLLDLDAEPGDVAGLDVATQGVSSPD
jgi:glutamate racemase